MDIRLLPEWGSGRTHLAVTQVPLMRSRTFESKPRAPPSTTSGDVAQLAERLPCKQEAVGSGPTISTTVWIQSRVGLTGEDATLSRWNDGLDTRTRRHFRDRCWGVAQWLKARDSDSRDDGSIPSTPASVQERGVMTAQPAFNRRGPGLSPGAPASGSTISP
jgi:hypothetical protein